MNRYEIVLAALAPAGGGKFSPVHVQKLLFLLDRNIPEEVRTITLSYSFFNAQKYLSEDDKNKLTAQADGGDANEDVTRKIL